MRGCLTRRALRIFLALLVALILLQAGFLDFGASSSPQVVFIVRTYHGHYDLKQVFNIQRHLESLQRQEERDWVAFLLNTDTTPLPDLPDHLKNDPRIREAPVKADNPYDAWVAGYDLTDAILSHPALDGFTWFVATNGDNVYHRKFLSMVRGRREDLVYCDFYSRYTITEEPTSHNKHRCNPAQLKLGYIDLGAAMLRLKRFRQEGHRFMSAGPCNSQDGLMFEELKRRGWTSHRVPQCLFGHAPNPFHCLRFGGLWNGSPASLKELADACWPLSSTQAQRALRVPELVQNGIVMREERERAAARETFAEEVAAFGAAIGVCKDKWNRTMR